MKTIQLTLVLFFSSQLMAGSHSHEMNDLNLTDEQKTQMKAVKAASKEKLKAAHKEIKKEAHAEMAEFLTPEQLKMVEERYEDRKEHRKEHKEMRKEHHQMKKGHKGKKSDEAMMDKDQ